MSTKTEQIQFAIQATGPGRVETLMGREFRVIPAVLVKAQVLPNNLGRTLLQAEDITDEWAEMANGAPVVIDHPTSRGVAVSARSPEVLNAHGTGFLFRTRAENGELKADVFLDTTRAQQLDALRTILAKLEKGETVELSTGFPAQIEERAGVFNGQEFDKVIRPIGFDHLAIFADKTGACSNDDGCGLGVNKMDDRATNKLTKAIEKFVALVNPRKAEDQMNRKQLIANLMESTGIAEAELMKLSDAQLEALASPGDGKKKDNAANKGDDLNGKGDGWDKAREWRAKFEALEAGTQNARESEQKERADLLDDLIYNASNLPWSEEEVRKMDIVELRKVHKLAFPKRANYLGLGGPRGDSSAAAFDFVKPIMAGNRGESVLDPRDKKEAV